MDTPPNPMYELTGDLEDVIAYLSGVPEGTAFNAQGGCGCPLHALLLEKSGVPGLDVLVLYDGYQYRGRRDAIHRRWKGPVHPMPPALYALQRHWVAYQTRHDGQPISAAAALTLAINQKDGLLTSDPRAIDDLYRE